MSTGAVANRRLTFGGAFRSEWRKLSTTRSVWWVAAVPMLIGAFMVLTSSADLETGMDGDTTMTLIATSFIVPWAVLAVYSALQATGEWSSGQYRVSLTAVPRRTLWMTAKATALAALSAIVALAMIVVAAAITLLRYAGAGATIDFTLPHTWQVVVGAPVVFALTAVMSVAIGVLVRSSGVAVTIVIGILVVLPFAGLLGLSGLEWVPHIASYLPSGAADGIVGSGAFGPATDDLGIVLGFTVLVGWAALAFVAASVAMKNRDA